MSLGLIVVVLLLASAAASIFWPLKAHRPARILEAGPSALELARDSKLGEIQDLEMDFGLGKLSVEDYQELNASLRSEAVEIMRALDHNGHHPPARRRPR